ncbi:MAG: hypothetical protein RLZZ339_1912 [Cyanobacteriota bacterium]|jgi:hypothetical protein|uniref:Uncharacterized protein n=1 Tax=Microcystis aeruginosa Ma_OC_H_19870700_S124 TaxID=2486262 RepID=A0A552AGG1_MICAE|nr:hypothetical protein [Microcystis aeruginosa]TRT84556.1 MAG: hypothetical protein EWV63_15070 [Microcystis aeruginosa Ma_OC_H_19870700_S124]
MAKIHISDLQVNSFQESLETAINRAIETRNIQGGGKSLPLGSTTLGIINWPPITLGIIYSPNGNL